MCRLFWSRRLFVFDFSPALVAPVSIFRPIRGFNDILTPPLEAVNPKKKRW
jgi:hypothetical protein